MPQGLVSVQSTLVMGSMGCIQLHVDESPQPELPLQLELCLHYIIRQAFFRLRLGAPKFNVRRSTFMFTASNLKLLTHPTSGT